MGDAAIRLLLTKAKAGDKDALEQLENQLWTARNLVAELAEGLDDEGLQEHVNDVLGWDEEEVEVELKTWYSVSWMEESYHEKFHNYTVNGPFASKKEAIKQECINWCGGEPDDTIYKPRDAVERDGQILVEPEDGSETLVIVASQDKDSLPGPPWERE